MAARQRLDGYGAPLPALSDARQQSLRTSATNQRQRLRIGALLEQEYDALLCRGSFAEVTVTFRIHDGSLQAEVDVSVTRYHHKED
jgi:hypothetical protein